MTLVKRYQQILSSLLRPVLRFCLQHGLKLHDVMGLVKGGFVELAQIELERQGQSATVSRIAAMTGVHRPDVRKFSKGKPALSTPSKHLISRLIGQWQSDDKFTDAKGKPRPLETEGTESEFAKLVRSVSTDLNPYTIRYELERAEIVKAKGSTLTLRVRHFDASRDQVEAYRLLARDAEDLFNAVSENLAVPEDGTNLHVTTEYDRIPVSIVPKLRSSLREAGDRFHHEARELLSKYDLDINSTKTAQPDVPTTRVSVCAFSTCGSNTGTFHPKNINKGA